EASDELKEANISGKVEMDKTMFDGRHAGKRGWGVSGKQPIFGLYQTNGKIFLIIGLKICFSCLPN
ncbi:MAG: hypothetical protein ACPL3Q_07380, partial [Candidatus Ratteibacteria bacterium]